MNADGYQRFNAFVGGKHVTLSVHRCVAKAFIPNPELKPQVNHINGIKHDNRSINLEWVTLKEQNIHAVQVLKKRRGSLHKNAKITEQDVIQIRNMSGSLQSIGKKFGIGISQTKRIKDRESWTHIS